MKTIRSAVLATLLGGTLFASPGEFPLSSAYIAPSSPVFYRMRHENGLYREFQRDIEHPANLAGAHGWKGLFSGGHIIIQAPAGKEGVHPTWVFEAGRLTRFLGAGVTNDIPYGLERAAPEGVAPPYFFGSREEARLKGKSGARKTVKDINETLFKNKWNKAERLSWPFANPNENGMLFAGFALLAFAVLVRARRLWLKLSAAAAFAVLSGALFLTFSRGAFLAAATGGLAILAAGRARLKDKATLAILGFLLGAAILGGGAFVCVKGTGHMEKVLTRGFNKKSSWSNEVRYKMWRMAPRMMADAPGGWGRFNIGRAYLDWYEDVDVLTAPGSLMNDHLTRMTRYGWTGRFFYAFSWFALLALAARRGWKKGDGAPFAAWAAFGVAAWFNPVMPNPWLWLAPSLSLLPAARDVALGAWRLARPQAGRGGDASAVLPLWRRAAKCALPAVCALSLAAAFAGGALWWICEKAVDVKTPVKISARDNRVALKSESPSNWVVDDGSTLGGIFTCKEMRSAYMHDPSLPAAGYARFVKDLPENGIGRLVLAGAAGDDWLKRVASSEAARKSLPREVVFISPPFPPSAIPDALFDSCRVRYATGEFNAMFIDELKPGSAWREEPWVEIVRGMELYLLEWMGYAVGMR